MTAIMDSRPKLVKWKPLVSGLICLFMFLVTMSMACDVSYKQLFITVTVHVCLALTGLI